MSEATRYTPSKVALSQASAFVEDMKALGYRPVRAIMFGSYAKFRQHHWSDIDLAVWDARFEGCTPFDMEPLLPLLRKYRTIELHTFAPDDLYDNHPFVKEIVDSGIEVEV